VTPKKTGVVSRAAGKRGSTVAAPEISVVVPTFDRADRIPELLNRLSRQSLDAGRFEVLVVDDCSTADIVSLVEGLAPDLPFAVHAIRTPSNAGPAATRNLGWRSASAPLLAFLDDDCSPEPSWLEAGLAALLAQPGAGVIQGRTLAPPGVDVLELPDWFLWRVVEESGPYFEGCNLFLRRSVLELTGGFDEEIGRYGEDTAAGWRVLEAGWERGFAADAVVVHAVEDRGWKWHVRNGLNERNLIHLAAKHPGYRREAFWRPWAFRKEDAAFVLAVLGAMMAVRFRPAILLAVPYVLYRRPSYKKKNFLELCLQIPVVDGARVLGHIQGAIENRVLVI
jgi:GT2 family glycosyltransferase